MRKRQDFIPIPSMDEVNPTHEQASPTPAATPQTQVGDQSKVPSAEEWTRSWAEQTGQMEQTAPAPKEQEPTDRTKEIIRLAHPGKFNPKSYPDGGAVAGVAPEQKEDEDVIGKLISDGYEKYGEDEEKLARKKRNEQAVGGIADAARAVANLYFTTKDAPNMYDSKNTMHGKAQERYEKARAELDKHHAASMAYLQRLQAQRNADRTYNQSERRMELMMANQQRLADKQKADVEYKYQMLELNRQKAELDALYKAKKIDIDQYRAETARINAETNKTKAAYERASMDDYDKVEEYEYDTLGRKTKVTTTRRVNGNTIVTEKDLSDKGGSGGGGGKTTQSKKTKTQL